MRTRSAAQPTCRFHVPCAGARATLLILALAAAPASGGVWAAGDQLWKQATADDFGVILGTPEDGDGFGYAVATGDFNHDGFLDLAVGSPGEGDETTPGYGVVNVIYGGAGGISTVANQRFGQGTSGIPGAAEADDNFGFSLAAGRFDSDPYDDLAIGIPNENVGGHPDAGALVVIYGGAAGLVAAGAQIWHQDSTNVLGAAEDEDLFAWSLAAGDFDADGRDDLAIGIPGQIVAGHTEAGEVQILFGAPNGFDGGDTLWNQDDAIFGDSSAAALDLFGRSLAVGDFSADGVDDLAIGVPFDCAGADCGGSIQVIDFAPAGGPTGELWHQDIAGVPGAVEWADFFGETLAAGDFNGDSADDLAIGALGEAVGQADWTGAVNVLYGVDGSGLTAEGSELWHQDSTGIAGTADSDDAFGDALAAGDFDSDGRDDLAIGISHESVGATPAAGAVVILPGVAGGLSGTQSQYWNQDSPGILGGADAADHFGSTLAAGDFDGDGHSDLAIGVPGENQIAGAVNVLYGALFSDGFESEDTASWSSSSP